MKVLVSALALLAGVAQTQAQTSGLSTFSDAGSGVSIKLAIPDKTAAPFGMLMSIAAPVNVTWVGFATGACMLRSPLIVAWPNRSSVAVTTRWAT